MATVQKVTADDVRQLMQAVAELHAEVERLKKQQPGVQKILITNALATGAALGIGLFVAGLLIAVVFVMVGGLALLQ